MTRNWIVTHQDYWPVYGRTREEAETEAIHQWFGGEATEFVSAEAWGIVQVRRLTPEPASEEEEEVLWFKDTSGNLHPLFDAILSHIRPPKDQP